MASQKGCSRHEHKAAHRLLLRQNFAPRLFIVLVLSFSLFSIPVFAQFNTPLLDGVISAGEYGTHTDGNNQQTNGGTVWYMTWDATNLYIGISGANVLEGAVIYVDGNPVAPINGGTNSNGTLVGQGYDNTNFAALQFRADHISYFKDGYREHRTANGSNGWSSQTAFSGSYWSNGSNVREYAIPWSNITGSGMPSSFNWFGYVTSSGGFVYGEMPTENGQGNIGTSARESRYFTVSTTTNGGSTKPFSRNSYVFNSTTDVSGFGSISVYDFTMNAAGLQVFRGGIGSTWTIGGNLRVDAGTIHFDNNTGAATVSGNVVIGSSGTLNLGNNIGGDLNVAGHWTNNGTFNANSRAVTFNGSGTQTISGSSTTNFGFLTVNQSSAGIVEAVSPITMTSGNLTLTQGTLKISSASTITPFSGSVNIPANAGFHLNHASAVSNWGSSGSLDLDGKLILDNGTMTVGSGSGNELTMNAATTEATINGGTLSLAGRVRVVSSGAGNGLTITGGEVVVTTVGNSSSSDPNFNIGATGKFTMTGGTVTFERANGNVSGGELVIASGSGTKSITGGTMRVGNAATPAAQIIEINSAVPIFHLLVNSANATAQLASALDVNGNLSINAGALHANNFDINLAGNWTNSGTFTPGLGTVTMAGTSTQTMSGSTFYNLTINNASGVSLLSDETVSNTLTLTSGNVSTGANKMIIAAGGNVSRTSGHIVGNLQKNFATGANFLRTFEIGDASNYTPVEVTITSVNTAGNLTAKSTNGDHANIGTSDLDAAKSVNRNWTLTSDGVLAFTNYDAVFNFVPGDLDGGTNTNNLIVGKFNSPNWSYPTVGTRTATSTQATGMTSFSDFQLAECTPPSVSFTSVGPYCVNDAAVDLTAFVSPAGGTFSGTGVTSAGIFTPSSAGAATHTITYTFTSSSNCTNTASQDIVVNPLPVVTFNAVSAVCVNASAIDLTSYVSPSGGTFSGDGVTAAGIFTPSDAGTGTHTITYTFTSGSNCTNTASQDIVVNPLPSVTFNAISAVCVNASAIDLTSHVSPSGGTFSGAGVTAAGIFTPSDAGAGTHTITYSFTDGNSCTNTASQNLVVNPLPTVTFTSAGPYCLNSPAVDLTSLVSPSGGTFSGDGVTSAGIFTPSDAGMGTHTITYSFTDGNNCTNTASQNITVETLPTVTFNPAGPYCVNNAAVDLTAFVSPSGGTFSGDGVTAAGIFTPSDAGTGTHTITYTFTSGSNCTNTASQDIMVNPLPSVTFTAAAPYCLNSMAVDLTSFVSPSGGTFSGTGVTSAGIFTPSDAGAGTHTITYSFTDGNSCTNTASQDILVNPLPSVTFNPVGAFLVTDVAVDLSPAVSPSGGTFSGPGISGTMFDPSVAGVGTHTVTYSFTDGNSCTNSASQNITVNPVTPAGKAFVFLSNKLTLKRTKQSTPAGDMHANGALTIEKGDPSTYNSNLTATGKITIQKDNTINGNVKSPLAISNSGTVNGTITVGAVSNEPLPSLSYSAGGANKTVPSGGMLTLAPGSYGIVTINSGGTLKLASGEYFMTELRALSSETVIALDLTSGDPATINVVNNLQLGKEAAIQLLPNGEGDSELVTFNTLQSSAVNFGKEAYLLGSFNAPNAKVTLVKNTQLRGAICANEILVERDCLFLHHSSSGSLPGPGNLPKSFGDEEEVVSDQLSVVSDYALEQNYPNPFNPSTIISFQLPVASEMSLSIYNTSGQLVKRLIAGAMNAGQHTFTWDATNERGERVASGVYLYILRAGEFTSQKKLVLMK